MVKFASIVRFELVVTENNVRFQIDRSIVKGNT